jgi:hypothetical protein
MSTPVSIVPFADNKPVIGWNIVELFCTSWILKYEGSLGSPIHLMVLGPVKQHI